MPLSILPPHPMIHSPPFLDALSPFTDSGDLSSEDGDTLHTPLTELIELQQHSYSGDHRHYDHEFAPGNFQTFSNQPHPSSSSATLDAKTIPLPPLAQPSASLLSGSFFDGHISSSPHALDLANLSLELGQFTTSTSALSLDPNVAPFIPVNQSFDLTIDDITADPSKVASTSSMPIVLPSLPLLSITGLGDEPSPQFDESASLSFIRPGLQHASQFENLHFMCGRMYSPRFPSDHTLNPFFVRTYQLGEELGAGGYGFVMTARHRTEGHEVAVKFIIKDKVPDHAWWEDEAFGKIPTEVMMLTLVDHENVVKCLDLYEDELYFYLVQELHGTPWVSKKKHREKQVTAPGKLLVPSPISTPSLTPSPSYESGLDSLPHTPPQLCIEVGEHFPTPLVHTTQLGQEPHDSPDMPAVPLKPQPYLHASALDPRPSFARRPSHDLFECIEQSKHKRLSESQARYIFAQVVEAVHYLDSQGITHCDIKDENLVIDRDLKVKLIDFGSAVVADPTGPPPYYTLFFGTTAYASSEILRKLPYRAPPAEIWTIGVLLSYLLTGHSPFPSEQDAIAGHIVLRESSKGAGAGRISRAALSLMSRCLEMDPDQRATINEVRVHRWLQGALDRPEKE